MRARGLVWPSILVMVLILGAGGAYLSWPLIDSLLQPRPAATASAPVPVPVKVSLGERLLTVPRDLVRFPGQRYDGPTERLELALRWPPREAGTAEIAPSEAARGTVYILLSLPDDSLDPARRFAALYQRYLDPATISAPQGLTGRRFLPDIGYDKEELFYDPASPAAYFVRCAAPIADQPGICLREIRLANKLDVIYRFPRDVLNSWRRLDQTVLALLAAIGAAEH